MSERTQITEAMHNGAVAQNRRLYAFQRGLSRMEINATHRLIEAQVHFESGSADSRDLELAMAQKELIDGVVKLFNETVGGAA